MAFIFHNIWDVFLPIDELIFSRWFLTTNQIMINREIHLDYLDPPKTPKWDLLSREQTYPLFLWKIFFLDTLAAVNIGYDKCPILETCQLKIQNGHVSGKVVPPSGGSRETARRLPPRTPQHLYFQTPIGLKSKTALITKRWRKKGSQLLPEERIIDDARGWAGRLGVHSKNQLHLLRVG